MNVKLKMTFVILATLILGIIIGAMLSRVLIQNRIRNIISKRNPAVFVPFFEDRIEPRPRQSNEIREILRKYAKRIDEIHANFRVELESSFESLRTELEPLLTPEQKKRLERGLPGRPPWQPGRPPWQLGFLVTRNLDKVLLEMKKKLKLTEDQTSQIRQILEELRGQAKKAREELERRRERWRSMLESEEKIDKAIEQVLTDEQKKLYEQFIRERRKVRRFRELMEEKGPPGF
jgi:hypothetical protein